MHLLVVVPARIGSSRLPEKPLQMLGGDPLVLHAARGVAGLGLPARIVVASDDRRVLDVVAPLGIDVVLTRGAHRCGTERVAEVAARAPYRAYEVVVNVQGDQVLRDGAAVRGALEALERGHPVGTAAVPLSASSWVDPHRVKVVWEARTGRALRFARTVPGSAAWPYPIGLGEHVGVYAYTRRALERWATLPPVRAEEREGLEQLRPLAHGLGVGVVEVPGPGPLSIDTRDDLVRAQEQLVAAGQGGTG